MSSQRNFRAVGKNLILISNLILNNQNICKLLKYTTKTPLSEPNILDTTELMNKNIRLIPKVPDELGVKESFIIILLDGFTVDPTNMESKLTTLRFDVLCPMDEWLVNEDSLRPFLIMAELQEIFDNLQIKGIGKLHFIETERIVGSDIYAGYSMIFNNYEFN